jgi:hypothetical protein
MTGSHFSLVILTVTFVRITVLPLFVEINHSTATEEVRTQQIHREDLVAINELQQETRGKN